MRNSRRLILSHYCLDAGCIVLLGLPQQQNAIDTSPTHSGLNAPLLSLREVNIGGKAKMWRHLVMDCILPPKLPPVELQPPTVSLETKCFQKYLRPYVSIPIQLILSRDLDTDRLFQSNGHRRTLQGGQLATLEADPRASYLTHLNW